MKIYTKTGDKGTTALFGGTRVPKHHIRIESYGTVDELNSHIGLIRDQDINTHYKELLIHVQDRLFTVGAILATDPDKSIFKNGRERLNIPKISSEKNGRERLNIPKISSENIELLEKKIDIMNEALPPMTHFVLPGGHQTVSFCHIARCVCRRAERLATALNDISPVDSNTLIYLNRLSDYLFVLARKLSFDLKANEIKWIPEKH